MLSYKIKIKKNETNKQTKIHQKLNHIHFISLYSTINSITQSLVLSVEIENKYIKKIVDHHHHHHQHRYSGNNPLPAFILSLNQIYKCLLL